MKQFIAYALVVSGIPILAGYLLGMIVTMLVGLVAWLFRLRSRPDASKDDVIGTAVSEVNPAKKKIVDTCMGTASGFGAVFAAAIIFRFLNQPLGLAVLIIIAAWKIFYFSVSIKYGQSFLYMFWSLVGVLIGWYDVFRVFSF
jgi:hypothetical protein